MRKNEFIFIDPWVKEHQGFVLGAFLLAGVGLPTVISTGIVYMYNNHSYQADQEITESNGSMNIRSLTSQKPALK